MWASCKTANSYDVLALQLQLPLLECREPGLSFFTKLFWFTTYKTQTPFDLEVRDAGQQLVLRLKRGVSIFRCTVQVLDGNDVLLGRFRQRLLSLGGKLDLLDADDEVVCTVQGKLTSFEYKFTRNGEPIGLVTKQWMDLGRELFTSADSYVINIEPTVPATDDVRRLVLAAALRIDMVFAE